MKGLKIFKNVTVTDTVVYLILYLESQNISKVIPLTIVVIQLVFMNFHPEIQEMHFS